MVGMIAGAWAKGQKDRRGRSSPFSLPLRLKIMRAHVEPILTTFCRSVELHRGSQKAALLE